MFLFSSSAPAQIMHNFLSDFSLWKKKKPQYEDESVSTDTEARTKTSRKRQVSMHLYASTQAFELIKIDSFFRSGTGRSVEARALHWCLAAS